MNSAWKCACLVLGMTTLWLALLAPSVGADKETEKENKTYHEQKLATLIGRKTYASFDYSVAILHIATEIIDPAFPAGRTTTVYKTIYFPKVDQFTELRSNFTQALVEHPNTTVRVWLEFPAFNLRSESRVMLYKYNSTDDKKDLLVGCRAITVVVNQGVMTDLYWDDTCNGCSDDYCIERSCSSVIEDLRPVCGNSDALKEDPFHCGIKIYIAWIGTDKKNVTLNSYTSVPSRFEKYSFIASAYDAASGFAHDFISFWKKPLN